MPCQEASGICLAAAQKTCRAGDPRPAPATCRTTYKRLQSGDAIRAWLRHRKRMTIMRRKAFHFSVRAEPWRVRVGNELPTLPG